MGWDKCELRSLSFGFWVAAGAIGLGAMCFVIARILRIWYRGTQGGRVAIEHSHSLAAVGNVDSLYGPLLEEVGRDEAREAQWQIAEEEQAGRVGEGRALQRRLERRIDFWVSFGAFGEGLFAVVFLATAITFAFHLMGHSFSWIVELVLLLLMLAAKCTVAIAAGLIHRHMSPLSRNAAGLWVLVFAVSKFATACFALAFLSPLLYLTSINHSAIKAYQVCTAVNLASTPALGVVCLQMLSSSALIMLHYRFRSCRAQPNLGGAGDRSVAVSHTTVTGCWWHVFCTCTCSVCLFWYIGSALVLLAVQEVRGAPEGAAVMFILVALAQITVGISLHKMNGTVKAYYSRGGGQMEPVELKEGQADLRHLQGRAVDLCWMPPTSGTENASLPPNAGGQVDNQQSHTPTEDAETEFSKKQSFQVASGGSLSSELLPSPQHIRGQFQLFQEAGHAQDQGNEQSLPVCTDSCRSAREPCSVTGLSQQPTHENIENIQVRDVSYTNV